jgi:general secretion pathway protein F/type IV pilus assembly protein PilC
MVRAGEQGGFLEDVLMRISIFTERRDELRNKLLGSMIYPCILLLAGSSVVVFLMAFVVPKIKMFLDKVDKPWITDVLFAFCDLLRGTWIYVLALLIIAGIGLVPLLRDERVKESFDRFKLRVPVVGNIITMVAVCRFCRILGTMLNNGVPILQALNISKDSAGNRILAEQIGKATENVQRGEQLAVPLGESGLFPADIVDMIAVAEESNNLENVLVQIADSNEARTSRQIDLGVRLLEPILLMFMAGLVLLIAIALLVPILKMSAAAAG